MGKPNCVLWVKLGERIIGTQLFPNLPEKVPLDMKQVFKRSIPVLLVLV